GWDKILKKVLLTRDFFIDLKMPTQKRTLLTRFLIWRIKYISHKQFVLILSIIVGLLAGTGAVILKNFTHLIQYLLEGNLIAHYQTAFYFIFPLIGLTLVMVTMRFIIRHKVSHGIPSTLYAISKRKGFMRPFQMFGSLIT